MYVCMDVFIREFCLICIADGLVLLLVKVLSHVIYGLWTYLSSWVEVTAGEVNVDGTLLGISSLAVFPVKILPFPPETLLCSACWTIAMSPASTVLGSTESTMAWIKNGSHFYLFYIWLECLCLHGDTSCTQGRVEESSTLSRSGTHHWFPGCFSLGESYWSGLLHSQVQG